MKLFTLIFLISLLGQLVYSQIDLNNGLGAHYSFNGTLNDASSFAIDGTNYGASQVNGLDNAVNGAYFFSSSSQTYIDFGTNNRGVTDIVTVSIWIKTTTTQEQMVLAKYNYVVDKGYELVIENGRMKFTGRDGSGSFRHSGLSTAVVNDGEWHHVVGVVNQNTWEIWIDCNLENSSNYAVASPDISNNEPLVAGMWYTGDGAGNYYYFDGAIDELRIYNRILTSDEMDSLCTRPQVLGINNSDLNNNIGLYPNPTRGKFLISSDNLHSLNIYNLQGQLIQSHSVFDNSEIEIDLSHENSGIYIVEITTIFNELLKLKVVKTDL